MTHVWQINTRTKKKTQWDSNWSTFAFFNEKITTFIKSKTILEFFPLKAANGGKSLWKSIKVFMLLKEAEDLGKAL